MSSIDIAKLDLTSIAVIVVVGLVGGVIAKKIKVPDIVLFLVFGIAIGPSLWDCLVSRAFSMFPLSLR